MTTERKPTHLRSGFWSSLPLSRLEKAGGRLVLLHQSKSPQAYVFAASALRAVRNLTTPTADDANPTVLEGLDQNLVRASTMMNLQWVSYELVLNLIFRRPIFPVWIALREKPVHDGALMQNISVAFLSALAIFEGTRDGKEIDEADRTLVKETMSRFEAFAKNAGTKDDFSAMIAVLKAAQLTTTPSTPYFEVVDAFEDAIDTASKQSLHLLEGLACETLVDYIMKATAKRRGMRAVQGYLVQAFRAYSTVRDCISSALMVLADHDRLQWGALSKCQHLLGEWPELRGQVMALAANPIFRRSRRRTYTPSNRSDPGTNSTALTLSALGELNGASPRDLPTLGESIMPLSTDASLNTSGGKSYFDRGEHQGSTSAKDKRSLDVASLLAASYGWQTETDMRSLVVRKIPTLRGRATLNVSSQRKLLKVLLQHSGGTFGAIALTEGDRGLVLRAAGTATDLQGDLDLVSSSDSRRASG